MCQDKVVEEQVSCCGLAVSSLGDAQAEGVAAMFKALGDPVRLKLAAQIAAVDEACVCDLTPQFSQSDSTISHHLKVLRDAGLVDSQRRGTWVYYRIRPSALAVLRRVLSSLQGDSIVAS